MNVVGLMSTYREGQLARGALESLQRVGLDRLIVYEGPAGEPLGADVPETDLGPDYPVHAYYHGRWRTDGRKRDAMLQHVHSLKLEPPVWGVWLDGDEILCNAEYLRDVLQARAWEDEAKGADVNDPDNPPFARWPLRLVEADGAISLITGRVVRLDLLRKIHVSTSMVENVHGVMDGWGNVKEDARIWIDHWMLGIDKGQMVAWPPLPCEPFIYHRPHLRHPLRRGARMHRQETVELAKAKARDTA